MKVNITYSFFLLLNNYFYRVIGSYIYDIVMHVTNINAKRKDTVKWKDEFSLKIKISVIS